jgi:hypothetical protein
MLLTEHLGRAALSADKIDWREKLIKCNKLETILAVEDRKN